MRPAPRVTVQKAEGNLALNSPRLADQDDWYLVRQLQNYKSGLRGSNPKDVYGMQMKADGGDARERPGDQQRGRLHPFAQVMRREPRVASRLTVDLGALARNYRTLCVCRRAVGVWRRRQGERLRTRRGGDRARVWPPKDVRRSSSPRSPKASRCATSSMRPKSTYSDGVTRSRRRARRNTIWCRSSTPMRSSTRGDPIVPDRSRCTSTPA